jgi:hypothetical protein
MEFIDQIANIIYSKENIDRANEYILSRGINPNQLAFPYTCTSSLEAHFWRFREKYPPYLFIDSLYIPIVDIRDGKTLVGFDIRYNGTSDKRTRWHKFKRRDEDIFIYNFQEFKKNLDWPVLIVESALDVETIRSLGLNITCISFLTAISHIRSVLFLYAMGSKIFYMYDNDSSGSSAISRILKTISFNTEVMNNFTFISYRGKDPNGALEMMGSSYLSQTIQAQI